MFLGCAKKGKYLKGIYFYILIYFTRKKILGVPIIVDNVFCREHLVTLYLKGCA